jgi:predicted DNA-binding transcriptional regulator YafY
MGPGLWDAEALSKELGCSVRTIHRILQSLVEAGIPCRFDNELRAYKVPRGFRFPGLEPDNVPVPRPIDAKQVALAARRFLGDLERTTITLKELLAAIEH